MIPPKEMKEPYKGLTPYSPEDAAFFFGRERERNFITANLLAERLTLLYGASGVGKSSVLRAGVEHHLRRLAEENIDRLGKPKYVVVFFNEWREVNPVVSLLQRVQESVTRTLVAEEIEPVSSSLQLTEALLEWSMRARGQLLIILDQFEEYFLYHHHEDGKGTFAEEFPRAVRNPELPANFLVSFREDAFAKMAFFKLRMPDLFGNYLPIDHLDRNAGRDAIEKPIAQYNKQFGNGAGPVRIEPALVEEVLKQVETGQVVLGETGRGMLKKETAVAQIETPFLQMVMKRLWEEDAASGVLRLETLNQLGNEETNETGAERIVRTHLDKKMGALTPERQDIAAELFHYLVTPGGTKIAHTAPDLADYAKLPEADIKPVLQDLAGDTRILRGVADKRSETRYEIFHDVLAAPILDWRTRHVRAGEAIEAARIAAHQKEEAEKQAREEEKAKSAKRLRLAAGILFVMFLFAVLAFLWALKQRSVARIQAQEADAARTVAQEEKRKVETQSNLLAAQTILLKKATDEAIDDKKKAVDQAGIAQANETKAKAAKARADRLVGSLKTTVQEERKAAENNKYSILELREPCDQKKALEDNLREFHTFRRKYSILTDEVQKANKSIGEITDRLRLLRLVDCSSLTAP